MIDLPCPPTRVILLTAVEEVTTATALTLHTHTRGGEERPIHDGVLLVCITRIKADRCSLAGGTSYGIRVNCVLTTLQPSRAPIVLAGTATHRQPVLGSLLGCNVLGIRFTREHSRTSAGLIAYLGTFTHESRGKGPRGGFILAETLVQNGTAGEH